jgi:DNA replicative helicase MCM subunit Mcm2 (Cdc46/Mcm family)
MLTLNCTKIRDFQPHFIKNCKNLTYFSSVSIVFSNNQKLFIQPMNNLKADQIGFLVVTKGIVTRISEVKP